MKKLFLLTFLLLMLSAVSTNIIAMEELNRDIQNRIFPFCPDLNMPSNAIDEIIGLTHQEHAGPLYREKDEIAEETGDVLSCGDSYKKKKDKDKKNQGKKDEDNLFLNVNIPLGTIPFKPLIGHGIGYTALLTVILDGYFTFSNSFNLNKDAPKKIGSTNNLMNIYYIINMLTQVNGVYVNTLVDRLHREYTKAIILPKSITMDTYKDKTQVPIESQHMTNLLVLNQKIDRTILCTNSHLLYAYQPLKNNNMDVLLQLLLHLYTLWKSDGVNSIVEKLSADIVLFLKITEVKGMPEHNESLQNAFTKLSTELMAYKGFGKEKEDQNIKKNSMVHEFLYELDKYVRHLIEVPVSSKGGKDARSLGGKRKKNIDPDSFYEQYKEPIHIARNVGVLILISGLLYRLIYNQKVQVI